jgi:hypothetical protein
MTKLEIEVQDGDITVTLPNTSYTVTYYKPKNSPQLLAKRIATRDDPLVAMTLSEFLAAAWRLADNKARALGWINVAGPINQISTICSSRPARFYTSSLQLLGTMVSSS